MHTSQQLVLLFCFGCPCLVVSLLAGCRKEHTEPSTAPSHQAIQRCKLAMERVSSGNVAPNQRSVMLAEGCKDVVTDLTCRSAVAGLAGIPPEGRSFRLLEACVLPLCEKLKADFPPRLCRVKITDIPPTERLLLMPEFQLAFIRQSLCASLDDPKPVLCRTRGAPENAADFQNQLAEIQQAGAGKLSTESMTAVLIPGLVMTTSAMVVEPVTLEIKETDMEPSEAKTSNKTCPFLWKSTDWQLTLCLPVKPLFHSADDPTRSWAFLGSQVGWPFLAGYRFSVSLLPPEPLEKAQTRLEALEQDPKQRDHITHLGRFPVEQLALRYNDHSITAQCPGLVVLVFGPRNNLEFSTPLCGVSDDFQKETETELSEIISSLRWWL